jgi:NAD(P)-dependent dehydrogenase (short-subunit alcohol dehydrogenase family)
MLKNKVALVTGGASGIGLAVVDVFATYQAQIVILDSDTTALMEVVKRLEIDGVQVIGINGSVTSVEDCEAAVSAAVTTFGGLDVLSHNAGIQRYGTIESTPKNLWNEVLDVNLTGAFLVSKAAVPELRKRKGSIVFMSSLQGIASQENVLAYSVSKHGLIGLTRSMAVDLATAGVRVNAVAPAAIDTPMLRHTVSLDLNPDELWDNIQKMHPMERCGQPHEVAELVAFIASGKVGFMTGEVINVDGGLRAKIPGTPKK